MLSIYAANFLRISPKVIGVRCAIVVKQVGATVNASPDRLIGTAIGALVEAPVGTCGPVFKQEILRTLRKRTMLARRKNLRPGFFQQAGQARPKSPHQKMPNEISRNGMRFSAECSVLHSPRFRLRARLPLIFNWGSRANRPLI